MRKTFGVLFATGSFLLVILCVFGFFIFKRFDEGLPNYDQLKEYNPIITTRLYATDGSLMTEFSKEKRIFVPIDLIPKNLINAFLAAEDSNFYKHSGIDPVAILRTSVRNFFGMLTGNQGMGGASTITQQVVKNFLLTREKTIQRKVKEAILAYRMSKTFPKDRILELYLNQIYLGSGAYGVAAAAQVYFNKPIDELGVEEAALLATLPKAPSKLDPRKNIEKAKIRRDWVIARMMEEQFITEEEGKAAIEKPIVITRKDIEERTKADFFADSVKKELTELYGSDSVFENGIMVYTTLDQRLQKIAATAFAAGIEEYDLKNGYRGALGKIDASGNWQEELRKFDVKKLYKEEWQKAVVLSLTNNTATVGTESGSIGTIDFASLKWARKFINADSLGPVVKKISEVLTPGDIILVEAIGDKSTSESTQFLLRQVPEVNGGFLVMDPHTGRVVAMMGGYVDAPNQFNRSTQAMRQPGSTMKTFGYIAALESGMNPATVIIDEPVSLNQGIGLPPYTPSNYSGEFYGPTTLRMGLEQSRNVTTVRMADQIGLDKIVDVVKRFGVNDNPNKIYSLVLGSTETTVLRMATAYSMMVNGGKKISPSMIEKIQDRDGKIIYRRDKRECANCSLTDIENFSEQKAAEVAMTPFLDESRESIIDPATAYQITSILQGAVERGTAGRAKSIGKIIGGKTGTTNSSYDSWFVGFSADLVAAVYVGFDTPKTLGRSETGASVALPIFVNFMKEALKNSPSTPFRVPNTVKFVKINRINGKLATPKTPKEEVLFEAFKLEDKVMEEGEEDDGGDSSAIDENAEDSVNSQVQGIY